MARYHRRSTPKTGTSASENWTSRSGRECGGFPALLRVADGLDRSHYQNLRRLEMEKGEERIRPCSSTESDPELEIWGAMRERHLFEEVTGRSLQIHRARRRGG
ncbi:MAG: hypothetical protein U5K31_09600 [Balneolaceae bacterium]|nr:hypothetical protein [Balneolaceae bacterium]